MALLYHEVVRRILVCHNPIDGHSSEGCTVGKTYIGGPERGLQGGMAYSIVANNMPLSPTPEQRNAYQIGLQGLLASSGLLVSIVVTHVGTVHVGVRPSSNQVQRIALLRNVLSALEAMKLHDPTPGIESEVPGLQ